jgi:hypothetical protein
VNEPTTSRPNRQRDPEVFARALRAIATEEASRGPCPATGGRHALGEDQVNRLMAYGGQERCRSCAMTVRLVDAGAINAALTMIDRARVYAGLPRFSEDQRMFVRALLSARDPFITATQQMHAFAELVDEVDGR